MILLAVGIIAALSYWLIRNNERNAGHTLRLSGHMEVTETDLAFKVPGKIAVIHFEEGQEIKAGQVVAELEAQDLREDLAMAEATACSISASTSRRIPSRVSGVTTPSPKRN